MKFEYERTSYEEFKLQMEISSIWDTLQSKSEYLSVASEKGYQTVAALTAGRLAHILKVDADLSEALTMCKGAYFPIDGKAGKKCMMSYLDEKGISVFETMLGTNFIKYHLNRRKDVVTPEIEAMLIELFDDDNESDIIEVQIARFCHQIIENIKKIQKSDKKYEGNLLYDVNEDIIDQCEKTGKLAYDSMLLELLDGVEVKEVELSKEEHDRLYKLLDKCMNEFHENGIYNFIALPDLSER